MSEEQGINFVCPNCRRPMMRRRTDFVFQCGFCGHESQYSGSGYVIEDDKSE